MLLFVNDSLPKMSWHRAFILLVFGCTLQCSFIENRNCQQQVPYLETLLRLLAIRNQRIQNNSSSRQPAPYSSVPYPYCKSSYQDYSLNIAQGKPTSGLGPEYQIRLPLYMGQPVKTNIILELPLSMLPPKKQNSKPSSASSTPESDYCDEEDDYEDSIEYDEIEDNNVPTSSGDTTTESRSIQKYNKPDEYSSETNSKAGSTTAKTVPTEKGTSNKEDISKTSDSSSPACAETEPKDASDASGTSNKDNKQDTSQVNSKSSSPESIETTPASEDSKSGSKEKPTTATNSETGKASEPNTDMEPADNDDTTSTQGDTCSTADKALPKPADAENTSAQPKETATTTTTTTTTATEMSEVNSGDGDDGDVCEKPETASTDLATDSVASSSASSASAAGDDGAAAASSSAASSAASGS